MSRWPRACLAAALLLAFAAGCARVPLGIRTEKPEATDRIAVRPRPPGWRRIAVLPFGGDPAHCRPAEELVSLWVQRSSPLEVATPWAIRTAFLRPAGAVPALDSDAWARAYVEADDAAPLPREDVRAAARWLGADAIVLGRVAPGGASADLALVDGATGDAVAAVRRAGSPRAAELGVHELAVQSTGAALQALVEVLRTPPGVPPRVRLPARPAAPEEGSAP